MLAQPPPDAACSSDAEGCLRRWQYYHALSNPPAEDACELAPFGTLDCDCLRAVAAALLLHSEADHPASLDRRSRSLSSLSQTNKAAGWALSDMLLVMRRQHSARLRELDGLCVRLGTSLDAMRAAGALFRDKGHSTCAA